MHFGQSGNWLIAARMLLYAGSALYLLFIIFTARRRHAMHRQFADSDLYQRLSRNVSQRKRRWKRVLRLSGFILLAFCLLRPQWGYRGETLHLRGLDMMIAVDTSRSMDAQDLPPSRLQWTKQQIAEGLRLMKGDRLGLIAFAGSAFVHCPLTLDYNAFNIFLRVLDTGLIPYPGTSLDGAIESAILSFSESRLKEKILILFTDGEEHTGDALAAARRAADNDIRIYVVGVGSRKGAPIPGGESENGYKKDEQGNVVISKLDEGLLQKIASVSSGAYYRPDPEHNVVADILRDVENMERTELEERLFRHFEERYQGFLLIAFLLLAADALLTERRFRISREGGRFA